MQVRLAPLNPTVGDLPANASLILDAARAASSAGVDLLVLPELVLCGYPPKDLLAQHGFVPGCMNHAARIVAECPANLTIVFGTPWHIDPARDRPANALVAARNHVIITVYPKRLLPTYDVFDEDRYFAPGDHPAVIDVPTPSGARRVGLTICEDLWRGEDAGFSSRYSGLGDPVRDLALLKVDAIVSPSASPFVLGKGERHRRIVAAHARTHAIPVASVNQHGGNDELLFDGHAFAFGPDGELARGSLFTNVGTTFTLASPQPLAELPADEHQLFDALVMGIRDYLRKTGFRSAILGLSGGIDSALTAVLGCAAIGRDNMRGLAMPSRYSSDHSKSDAFELARRLGMRCDVIPIETGQIALTSTLDDYFDAVQQPRLGAKLPDITEENLQSRLRGTILMGVSNRTGAIVLTTGNKSELAVGYCTLYGDMNGGLAVLSDVSKQWVYRLSRWINAHYQSCGFSEPPIPEGTITKAPSAELRPNQTDQDSLPPYDVLDAIIDRYVEGRQSASQIISAGFDEPTVRRVLRLIDLSEYKRAQAAMGLKVTSVAFGSGRRWPIAQRWAHP
jgi:NAD+ synthase/NAD+ synthase (glutamine-hydrolysing)